MLPTLKKNNNNNQLVSNKKMQQIYLWQVEQVRFSFQSLQILWDKRKFCHFQLIQAIHSKFLPSVFCDNYHYSNFGFQLNSTDDNKLLVVCK